MSRRDVPGIVYQIHFDRKIGNQASKYGTARHYTGWASDLDARLAEHAAGRGSKLMAAVKAAGITWHVSRTWSGTRARERQLKTQGGASRRCPDCKTEEKSMEIKHDGKTVVEVTTDRAKGAPESKQVEVSSPLGGLQYQPKSGGKADPDIEFEMGG